MIPGQVVNLIEAGWNRASVLVIGDVMLDEYVWGEVSRISPEAPVPVVRAQHREHRPGGAANVATNLAQLGACVTLVGFAGDDSARDTLTTLIANANIEPLLISTPGVPTTTKQRILAGHQQIMRLDTEGGTAIPKESHTALLRQARAALSQATVMVLSDYAKGVLSEEVCQTLIAEAAKRNVPVLVDPKHRNFERYRNATAICPNLKELAAAVNIPATEVERVLNAGQSLVSPLGLHYIAATLGEQGIAVLRPEARLHSPAVVRQVYDVSGAGDTVIAVLALALTCGLPIETAVELANVAAGVVVGKIGTVPITREELLIELSHQAALLMDDKVLPPERLLSRVAAWRSRGERIVFTNGCFDLLHVGHIRLLEQARRHGDRLIVGLNSDASVRRLKGATRPIVEQQDRARVLAALSAVDSVTIFGEDTPLRLIQAIRPDVLVKGSDYNEANVVGAQEVRAWGGRLELIPLVPGVSTTHLVSKPTAHVATDEVREGAGA